MDNVTHSLVGIVLGRTLDRREGAAAGASIWTAVLASNAPDIDIVLPPIINGGKIEFLVHHRGWTHTLILVPVMALLAAAVAIGLRKWRRAEEPSRKEAIRLSKIAAVAVVLHIALDFLNSYGVHPFAPFSRRWIYGDAVFIFEPMMWWALLPFVASQTETRRRRVGWLALGIAPIGVLFFVGSPIAPVVVAVFALASFFAQRRMPGTGVAWAALVTVPLVFATASFAVRTAAARSIAGGVPTERRLDLVTTPAPGNPLCWRIQSAGIDGEDYVAREGTVTLAPSLVDATTCFPRLGEGTTANLTPSTAPSSREIEWRGEFRRTLASFRDQAEDCRVAALLGFVRIPYWGEKRRTAIYGDLRYDFDAKESFGEVVLDPKKPYCIGVPWIPPRADVLAAE